MAEWVEISMDLPSANYLIDNQRDGSQHSNLAILKHMVFIDRESLPGLEAVIARARRIRLDRHLGNRVTAHVDGKSNLSSHKSSPKTKRLIYR